MSKKPIAEEFRKILTDLEAEAPDIFASAIVRKDGLVVASAMPEDISGRLFAAMTVATFGASNRTMEELKQGGLKRVIVEAEDGQMIIMGVGSLVLTVLAKKDANLGLVLLSVERALEQLKKYA